MTRTASPLNAAFCCAAQRRILLALALWAGCAAAAAQEAPTLTIDDECTALAYAPDGRIVYSVRHILSTRHLDIQRDDVWLLGLDGKRRRILNGEKLIQGPRHAGPVPFSYAIQSLRWSPDGTKLTAEMLTSQMINEHGDTKEGVMTLLFDDSGKEIRIPGGDSVMPETTNAAWLADGATVVFLQEAVKPKLLFSVGSLRPAAGRGAALFADHAFLAVAWNAKLNTGVAIERDRSLSGPPRLVALDPIKDTTRELTTLDGYVGGLALSPSGARVAYYHDHGTIEVREMAAPERVARVRAAFGTFQWAPDEKRLLLKRALERKSGDLVWISLPALAVDTQRPGTAPVVSEIELQPVLHGLNFRDFDLSPDARFLAVLQPGKRNLLIYPLR